MDIKALKYFLAVARTGNMTAAAGEQFVTQSALSRQVTELQRELGTKLFFRENRRLRLTEDGRHLKHRAEEILAMVGKTEAELRAGSVLYGDIYVGAGETMAMTAVGKAVRNVQAQHPQVRFHIFSGTADVVTERIERGALDFGLLFEPISKERYEYIPFPVGDAADRLGLLMRPDCPLAGERKITPEMLGTVPIILGERFYSADFLHDWLGMPTERLNVVCTFNLTYNASVLVREGVGSAVTLSSLFSEPRPGGLIFAHLAPAVEMKLIFAWKKYRDLSKAEEFFLSELKAALAD